MKTAALLFASLFLAGCSAKYQSLDIKQSNERLKPNEKVFIATPKNGFYSETVYQSSGQETASAVQAAFSRYTDSVTISSQCTDVECLARTYPLQTGLFVVPSILHWEDRATEWSMKPDKIEVKISVYNAQDNSLITSTIISGASKIATWGGDHPQDLLATPVNRYVASLY